MVKNLPANARDVRDSGSIPGSGRSPGGGHGNPLQYYCLENPKDRGAWQTAVHRVEKSQTGLKWLSMYALICKVAITHIYLVIILIIHSCIYRRRKWHPTSVLLPGESHGWRSLVGCSPWGRKESDTTEWHSTRAHAREAPYYQRDVRTSRREYTRSSYQWAPYTVLANATATLSWLAAIDRSSFFFKVLSYEQTFPSHFLKYLPRWLLITPKK